jgi:hypothetical protein
MILLWSYIGSVGPDPALEIRMVREDVKYASREV